MSEHKNEGEFEDIFAGDDFAETEQDLNDESNTADILEGNGELGEGSPEAASKESSLNTGVLGSINLSKKDMAIYAVGGAVFLGVVYMVYRHFNPAVIVMKSHQGETRNIMSRRAPDWNKVKKKPKPKPKVVKKAPEGFLIDKKN